MKEKLWKRALALALLGLLWQGFALRLDSFLFPTLSDTLRALRDASLGEDQLLSYARETLFTLSLGFAAGILGAAVLLLLALSSAFGEAVVGALTALFAPLPAVSLLPLATLGFGAGPGTAEFLAGFAVLFPLTVASHQGIRSVSPTLVNVGRNLGLRGPGLFFRILLPAALPAVISGLRSGISGGFRALIAVELVMGAATGSGGGLGGFLLRQKQNLEIPTLFAGILAILLLASLFELLFQALEAATAGRRGRQKIS